MILRQTFNKRYLLFLFIFLTACGKQANVLQAVTPSPTETPPAPTSTSTQSITITPSPLPTESVILFITPDSIQVERWKEYEDALIKSILPTFSSESILCEWDILAQADQEVYVWAVCASSKVSDWRPAVIHLGADGSVLSVEIPKRGSSSDIDRMFPKEARMKFGLYTGNSLFDGRLKEMLNHLIYRETHPDEPPLIVFNATPTQ
ncbi:MAG TPA: hypothetical protein PKK96_17340 [Anaerolineales bacterium]|nr:hypothetical protein [Anaerolineales bacterium]HNQ94464.1 hypothetical protein [Anaerolineales bacterium]HNS62765.1 hypothetical protein [Anaerolineales bacterium]